MKKRFEHKITSAYKPNFVDELAELEEDGWELVGMNYQGWTVEYVIKRPVE